MGLIQKIRDRHNVRIVERYKMIQDCGNGFYSFDGVLYHSDIVRSCIKPKTKAIGKALAKHVRETVIDGKNEIKINPEVYMRFLLEEPNPLMTGQMLQEKVSNQLALNNNSFILIIKDENGVPVELYPIPCRQVYAVYNNNQLYLKFLFKNGKSSTFPYTDIIHIRDDYIDNDIFGESPGKALTDLMECVKTIDQGIVKAIKNSGVIRWLLKYTNSMRPEDLKRNVKAFADNYLSIESDTFGAAGTDAKAQVERVEPKDYVPNAMITKDIVRRIYDYFSTNEKIVSNSYSENEWIAYYEGAVEPILKQMSGEYTRKLFTRRERGCGNKIIFESSDLTFASMTTKLNLVQFVDRRIMTPNEVRKALNMAPIEGGDEMLLRKDTGIVGGEDNEDNTD